MCRLKVECDPAMESKKTKSSCVAVGCHLLFALCSRFDQSANDSSNHMQPLSIEHGLKERRMTCCTYRNTIAAQESGH